MSIRDNTDKHFFNRAKMGNKRLDTVRVQQPNKLLFWGGHWRENVVCFGSDVCIFCVSEQSPNENIT